MQIAIPSLSQYGPHLFPIEWPPFTYRWRISNFHCCQQSCPHSLLIKESYICSKWILCFWGGGEIFPNSLSFLPLIQWLGDTVGASPIFQFQAGVWASAHVHGWRAWHTAAGACWVWGGGAVPTRAQTPLGSHGRQLPVPAPGRVYFFWILPDPEKITLERILYRSVLLFFDRWTSTDLRGILPLEARLT